MTTTTLSTLRTNYSAALPADLRRVPQADVDARRLGGIRGHGRARRGRPAHQRPPGRDQRPARARDHGQREQVALGVRPHGHDDARPRDPRHGRRVPASHDPRDLPRASRTRAGSSSPSSCSWVCLGAVAGAVVFGLTVGIAIPLYAAKGVHHLPVDIGRYWLGATLATGCYALLGVAVGALVRNTVGAVIGALVWVQVVEQLLLANIFPELAKWLPTGAAVGLTVPANPGQDVLSPGDRAPRPPRMDGAHLRRRHRGQRPPRTPLTRSPPPTPHTTRSTAVNDTDITPRTPSRRRRSWEPPPRSRPQPWPGPGPRSPPRLAAPAPPRALPRAPPARRPPLAPAHHRSRCCASA